MIIPISLLYLNLVLRLVLSLQTMFFTFFVCLAVFLLLLEARHDMLGKGTQYWSPQASALVHCDSLHLSVSPILREVACLGTSIL